MTLVNVAIQGWAMPSGSWYQDPPSSRIATPVEDPVFLNTAWTVPR